MSKDTHSITFRPDEVDSFCWQVLATDQLDLNQTRRAIDVVFSRFSYHPEVEWDQFGFLPPEGYDILDAWRDPEKGAFAFLLRRPHQRNQNPDFQILVYAIAPQSILLWIDKKINSLKTGHSRRIVRTSEILGALHRLDQLNHTRSIVFFSGYLTLITALVNAFSHYLRTLDPPNFGSQTAQNVYVGLINFIHFSSLGLLTLVTIVCVLFLIKYSYILLKRL